MDSRYDHMIAHMRFPYSDISGSWLICSSPELFAAYHVFRRLLVPRHPPYALFSLIFFLSFFYRMSMNMRALHVRLCFINAFVLFYPLKLQQVLVHYLLFFSNVFFLREFTILYAVVKVLLVGSSGLEPPTSRLSGVRSNQLSYEPTWWR